MSQSEAEAHRKKWAEIVAKAWIDPKFKARLMQHPREVLNEAGIILPHNIQPKVLENPKDQTYYLLLPEKPKENMNESELKKVAAGKCMSSYT